MFLENASKLVKQSSDEMDQFVVQAARSIQGSLGDGLYNVLKGNFDGIGQSFADMLLKMAADAAAANLAKAMFGDFGKTGELGGWIGALGGLFGSSITASAGYTGGGAAMGSFAGLSYFSDGGFTGSGGKYDVAGVVHAGEYVINADATRKLGRGLLDRMNGYADGGFVGTSSMPPALAGGSPGLSVVMETHGVDVEVVEERERQYRFIARQEIDNRVPSLMAREQARPGSQFSRQQNASTNVQRRR